MATNEGHMSKLEAVNDMLLSVGESPVQSLASGLGDAAIAEAILDRVSREVQLKGWHVNTRRSVTLTKDVNDIFGVPVDTLKVDTVDPTSGRQINIPRQSSFVNAVMMRSADDTKWLLYDIDNNSETWENETELTVDIVKFLNFANLTPALQMYVWTSAAHRFQKGLLGSKVVFEYTSEDVLAAETQAVQEDAENEDLNVIRENRHVRSIAFRNNPHANS